MVSGRLVHARRAVSLIVSIDEEKGPRKHADTRVEPLSAYRARRPTELFRVDPAGHFVGFKACCTGQKEQQGNNLLEKEVKAKPKMTRAEAINVRNRRVWGALRDRLTAVCAQAAIMSLQTAVGVDLKPADIEVGLVTRENEE